MKIESEESEEMARFKELFPDMKSPDSLYDKSPVIKLQTCCCCCLFVVIVFLV